MVAASSLVLAASSLLGLSYAAPMSFARSVFERDSAYKVFGGDGTTAQGWPAKSSWKSFNDLWNANLGLLKSSCTQFNGAPNNSDDEINAIKAGITEAAASTGLPAEYIFVVIMQESKGCVRAPTSNYGVRNPGLMQDHNGANTCNENGRNWQNPCPRNTIVGMIHDGSDGTADGAGLKGTVEASNASDDSKYYKGARIYNSGRVADGGNLGAGIATHCYASDIANRLLGWVDSPSACHEDTIGGIGGGTNPGNGGNGNDPKYPNAAAGCTSWHTVVSGDGCWAIENAAGVPSGTLQRLNSGLDANCSNLWLGYAYCVKA